MKHHHPSTVVTAYNASGTTDLVGKDGFEGVERGVTPFDVITGCTV